MGGYFSESMSKLYCIVFCRHKSAINVMHLLYFCLNVIQTILYLFLLRYMLIQIKMMPYKIFKVSNYVNINFQMTMELNYNAPSSILWYSWLFVINKINIKLISYTNTNLIHAKPFKTYLELVSKLFRKFWGCFGNFDLCNRAQVIVYPEGIRCQSVSPLIASPLHLVWILHAYNMLFISSIAKIGDM